MNKTNKLAGLLLVLGLSTIFALEPAADQRVPVNDALHVTIIYDNYQLDKNLKPDWGFACLVEYQGHKVLVDAGRDSELFKENLGKLQIDPREVHALFISHEHGDHTAGVPWITEVNPSMKCYLPTPYARQLEIRESLPQNSKALAEPQHLFGPFYSTGDNFATFKEQGLIIKTEDGGILITGCGHPGAIPMITVAEKELNIEIHTLIGGLHLMDKSETELNQLAASLKKIGITQICPTHCTGDASIARFKEAFAEHFISGGVGKEIIIN